MADPYYANVSLLLPMNGADNGTVFTDYSPTPKTITRGGDTKTVTAQSQYYGSSGYFDGATDYLTGGSDWLSAGQFGTGNFTVGCWVRATGAPNNNQVIWTANSFPNSTGLYLMYATGLGNELYVKSGPATIITSSSGWSYNNWHHIEVVRSGTTLFLFIDGEQRGSATWANNCSDGLIYIGRPSDVNNYTFQGNMNDFIITNEVARHTTTFTPPAMLLSPVSGTILDINGAPCARTVHLFDRASGTKLGTTISDASTGQYTLYASGNEVIRVVLADEPTLYNDIVDRILPA